VTGPVEINLSSISDKRTTAKTESLVPTTFFGKFLKTISKHRNGSKIFSKGRPKVPLFTDYHLTTKTGPTGGQALLTSLLDLINLPECLCQDIFHLGGAKLKQNMLELIKNVPLLSEMLGQPIDGSNQFRKLSILEDKEFKSRPIAIADY
jgi:hypothetical protein